jgi:ATP-dependent 26S proteasome regulatory subunit
MEVDERPTEQYSDIGGLDKQIQEVISCHSFLLSNGISFIILLILVST